MNEWTHDFQQIENNKAVMSWSCWTFGWTHSLAKWLASRQLPPSMCDSHLHLSKISNDSNSWALQRTGQGKSYQKPRPLGRTSHSGVKAPLRFQASSCCWRIRHRWPGSALPERPSKFHSPSVPLLRQIQVFTGAATGRRQAGQSPVKF